MSGFNFANLRKKAANKSKKEEGDDLFGGLSFDSQPAEPAKKPPNVLDDLFSSVPATVISNVVTPPVTQPPPPIIQTDPTNINANYMQHVPPPNIYSPQPTSSIPPMNQMPQMSQIPPSVPLTPPVLSYTPQMPTQSSIDPVNKYLTQLSNGISQLLQEFTLVHNEESDVHDKLVKLEEVKLIAKNELIASQETQNVALSMEDYESADKANQEIEVNRRKISELDNQKTRGVMKSKETQSKKLEKLDRNYQLLLQQSKNLEQIIKSKEIENNNLKDSHSREYLKNLNLYNSFQEKVDNALLQNTSLTNDLKSKISVIEGQIYNETYQDIDEKDNQTNHKSMIDAQIAELEKQLSDLRNQSQECQLSINRCDNNINNVRKNYSLQLNPLQIQLKRAEDDNKRILTDQEKANSMNESLQNTKKQSDEFEVQKDNEINTLKSEFELLSFFIGKFQESTAIYNSIVQSSNTNANINNINNSLSIKKQQYENNKLKRQSYEERINSEREKIQHLETNIPLWEEQKKNSANTKNYNVAAKLSTQIKKAQSELETLNSNLQSIHNELATFDSNLQLELDEIERLQQELEHEELLNDINKADQLNIINNNFSLCLNQFDIKSNCSDIFKKTLHEMFTKYIELFENQMTKLYQRSGISNKSKGVTSNMSAFNYITPPPSNNPLPSTNHQAPPPTGRPIPPRPSPPAPQIKDKAAIQSRIDQLNAQIEEASSREDYELCEKLQQEIDSLNSQL